MAFDMERLRLPASRYPVQTKFAFRSGVTCLTTPAGAVLLNPPRNEKLTRLTAGQMRALKTLNVGPATLTELAGSGQPAAGDVAGLIDQLVGGGWLTLTVREDAKDRYTILPF